MPQRSELRSTVAAISASDQIERNHLDDALAWIDSGAPLYRTAKPATPPKHLVSYALLVDPEHDAALLIDHRIANLWLPTGGHVEPDETPFEAAARELTEEVGVEPDPLASCGPRPFFITVTPTVGPTPSHVDVSLWYAFTRSRHDPLCVDEREAANARWWPFPEIDDEQTDRFDPHLSRAVAKLRGALALSR
jgi:8-oxo-dGTP pyrophosphatase MutT (NUDIX family)